MKALGRYDTALQMFVEETREFGSRRLSFMRRLAEGGRLEHRVEARSGGLYSFDPEGQRQNAIRKALGEQIRIGKIENNSALTRDLDEIFRVMEVPLGESGLRRKVEGSINPERRR